MMLNHNRALSIGPANENIDVSDTSNFPIRILGTRTINTISHLLNPRKIFTTDEGIPRDWRGLAHCLDVPGEFLSSYSSRPDPTATILANQGRNITIKRLHDVLARLDRWDIIDDIKEFVEGDVRRHLLQIDSNPCEIEENVFEPHNIQNDQLCIEMNSYDAFVLHAEDDEHFAREVVSQMSARGLTLCTKDDLVGGQFEHEAVMNLIAERCNRLVVIVSPAFFESAANTFFTNFAQAIAIEQRKRKIIPCVFKQCPKLPYNLSIYYRLDFERFNRLGNFWDKLTESIQGRQCARNRTQSNVVIREIEQTPNKGMTIAHSLPNNLSAYPQLCGATSTDSNQKQEKHLVEDSLPNLPSLDNLSDLNSTSSQDLLTKPSEKSKKQKWLKKMVNNISISKKDKKKIAVVL